MDATQYKDEGVMAEELAKPEPPLNEQEMGNQQIVRKTMKKYQNKVSQMLKIIQKQKKHNQNLKEELKQLNENLNNVISKVANKSMKQHQQHPRDDVIRKELDNEIKKNVALQKELVQLRTKVKLVDGTKISQLHNEVTEKNKVIEQMKVTIKTYAKSEKIDKNMDIYKRQQELNHKVNLLNEEILFLKKKLNQQKKHQQIQQKSLKRQHQQIITLETKYKTTHTGGMMSPTKNKVRQENQRSSNQLQKLKESVESLQVTKKAAEKQFRHQMDGLKVRNKILENQLADAKDTLHRKQKEINILTSRLKEAQRRRDIRTLQPVQLARKSEDFAISGLFDQRKQFKGLVHVTGNTRKFDDTQILTLEKNYKIKKLAFSWFQQHIVSLDTLYQMNEGSVKQVASFRIAHTYQNVKFGQLTFSEFEYIKDIEVYCSKWIEFMRIRTSRDQLLEVGSDRNYTKCKQFNFDIRTNEKPIAFLGAIETKKVFGNQGKELLISFGLQIKKKQVTGRNMRFGRYPGKTESLTKYPSKSVFDSLSKNDKNILDD